ncbi:MAG: bifunctional UDP-3-O-[3-hydroxymyristoyl] N-acetylglucosamine deacetylase/3-hydroxyacyl-ACP dehydratase [Candidatus Aureabacteria bacterium]|nr:bifunctional UDP-3-O-[3-hydroxymyristoyl] N-acetylglucosamine deacetylase/3-hydroxyacyl-ACP dehydratase [Candidatus Auribacterota bacterium]
MQKQQTIKTPVCLSGVGVHTGNKTRLVFTPAPPNTGVRFVRTDIPGLPAVDAVATNVTSVCRGTTIACGGIEVHTVEHVLAAIRGCDVDNVVVELDSNEPPVGDGSATPYVRMIKSAGVEEQDAPREEFVVVEPVWASKDNAAIAIIPSPEYRVSYTMDFRHPTLPAQFVSFTVNEETFEREIASGRTFCFYHEIEALVKQGLIKGGSLENAVVIGDGVIYSKEQLRFPDEFARHKVLDLIGDMSLVGRRVRGHVIAMRSGHELNVELAKKLINVMGRSTSRTVPLRATEGMLMDVNDIKRILPHRFPFLLVDRIIEIKGREKIVAIKNVTANEPFFMGHFPERPVMPGVLIIEALAQTTGVLMLNTPENLGKLAFFMTIENAKFRRPVVPGDQLRLEVDVLRWKTKTGKVHGTALVDGQVAAEADLGFTFV